MSGILRTMALVTAVLATAMNVGGQKITATVTGTVTDHSSSA